MLDILNIITDPGHWHPDGVQHVYLQGLCGGIMYVYKNEICTTEYHTFYSW